MSLKKMFLNSDFDCTCLEENTQISYTTSIIGIGGYGCSLLNDIVKSGYDEHCHQRDEDRICKPIFIAIDSDKKALDACTAEHKIYVSQNDLDSGEYFTLEDCLHKLPQVDLAFIFVGLGGETGSTLAPCVAQYITEKKSSLTLGVVTLPSSHEEDACIITAKDALIALNQKVNSLVVIPKDEVLAEANMLAVNSFTRFMEVLLSDGLVGMDYEDMMGVFKHGGITKVGYGITNGKERAKQATELAINHTMLGPDVLEEALGVMYHIEADDSLSIDEIAESAGMIQESSHADARIIFNAHPNQNELVFSVFMYACLGQSMKILEDLKKT